MTKPAGRDLQNHRVSRVLRWDPTCLILVCPRPVQRASRVVTEGIPTRNPKAAVRLPAPTRFDVGWRKPTGGNLATEENQWRTGIRTSQSTLPSVTTRICWRLSGKLQRNVMRCGVTSSDCMRRSLAFGTPSPLGPVSTQCEPIGATHSGRAEAQAPIAAS
jgi:hypothetical protein